MRAPVAGILLAALAPFGIFRTGRVQEPMKCGSARVQYATFDESYSSRLKIKSSPERDIKLSSENRAFSPQHTHWLIQALPDTMKPGPWTTRIHIGAGDSAPDVELVFVDETNGGVSVRWLNEKLIFGEVWWGRIYATDFIFDIEQRKYTYREMAHFGELIVPCE